MQVSTSPTGHLRSTDWMPHIVSSCTSAHLWYTGCREASGNLQGPLHECTVHVCSCSPTPAFVAGSQPFHISPGSNASRAFGLMNSSWSSLCTHQSRQMDWPLAEQVVVGRYPSGAYNAPHAALAMIVGQASSAGRMASLLSLDASDLGARDNFLLRL